MNQRRNRPVIAGGAIVTLCGIGHSVVTLLQVAPHHGQAWFQGALWEQANRNITEFTPVTGAFWYSFNSFGFPLLMLGALVLALGLRGTAPPRPVAWLMMVWTVIGEITSGPSPLLLLLIAGVLMLIGASRRTPARRRAHHDQGGAADRLSTT